MAPPRERRMYAGSYLSLTTVLPAYVLAKTTPRATAHSPTPRATIRHHLWTPIDFERPARLIVDSFPSGRADAWPTPSERRRRIGRSPPTRGGLSRGESGRSCALGSSRRGARRHT